MVYLSTQAYQMDAVNITVKKNKKKTNKKEDAAYLLYRNVVQNRAQHRYKSWDYQQKVYTKTKVDVNNITERTKKALLVKPIDFIFENLDSSHVKPAVPIYLMEALSEYYYQAQGAKERELVIDAKIAGFKIPSLKKFTGNAYYQWDLYAPYFNLFQKSFASPMGEFAWLSYHYFLTDSVSSGDTLFYQLSFVPIRPTELTFYGHIWVNNKDFAVQSLFVEISPKVNINYLDQFYVHFKWGKVDGKWMLVYEKVFMDIALSDDFYGLYIEKESYFYKHSLALNHHAMDMLHERVMVSDSAEIYAGLLLEAERSVPLAIAEQQRYQLAEQAVDTRYVKRWYKLMEMMLTGYYPAGYLEPGPYYTFFSFNPIEGNRFKFGFTTHPSLVKNAQITANLAYGTLDKQFKYRLGAKYFFGKDLWRFLQVDYVNQYETLNPSPDAFEDDHFLRSLSRRTDPRFMHVKRLRGLYFFDWVNGLNNFLEINLQQYQPLGEINFQNNQGEFLPNLHNLVLRIGGRIALQEKMIYYGFRRFSLQTKKPQINYYYTKGFQWNGMGINYDKLNLSAYDRYYLGYLGYVDIHLNAEKIWGNLPYPLLLQHRGNDSYLLDNKAFNLMYPLEFVSDWYVSAFVEHNFNGMWMNHIPWVRKLKLREVIVARGVVGGLANGHEQILQFPQGLGALQHPYVEVGFGMENIFKALRVDCLWRLTNYKENQAMFTLNFALKIRP